MVDIEALGSRCVAIAGRKVSDVALYQRQKAVPLLEADILSAIFTHTKSSGLLEPESTLKKSSRQPCHALPLAVYTISSSSTIARISLVSTILSSSSHGILIPTFLGISTVAPIGIPLMLASS